MDATATPRGISLAVGELGARGRPTFYMTSRTAVSVNRIRSLRPSTVFVDVCPRDTHTPHGLSCLAHPFSLFCALSRFGVGPATVSQSLKEAVNLELMSLSAKLKIFVKRPHVARA